MPWYQSKHARLVVLIVLVFFAAGLVWRVTFSRSSSSSFRWSMEPTKPNLNTNPPAPGLVRIHGRWEAVRASLGLPPLPHAVITPGDSAVKPPVRTDMRASRFDLDRKRQAAARQLAPLHFSPDS